MTDQFDSANTVDTSRGARIVANIPGCGRYSLYASDLDAMIARHLPASPDQLLRKLENATGEPYPRVLGVVELLFILGEIEGRSADLRDEDAHRLARTSFDMTAEEREIEFGSAAELRAGTR